MLTQQLPAEWGRGISSDPSFGERMESFGDRMESFGDKVFQVGYGGPVTSLGGFGKEEK